MRSRLTEFPRVLVPWLAADVGVTSARVRTEVRRGNWRVIARGVVLTRPEEPTRADWATVGIALGGPSAALSGWDAAKVRGIGGERPPAGPVLVLSRHASNRVVGGVRIRETRRPYDAHVTSADLRDYALTPIVPAARAVADAALAYRRLSPVRAMVTAAVQRGLASVPQLIAELDAAPRNGTAFLRDALEDVRDGARSEAEARAARRLTAARLPGFELNVPIVDQHDVLIAVADVLWRDLRAVLEIDSREFHFSEREWKQTMARHNRLTRAGLTVTHYAPSVVTGRATDWVGEVSGWLDERAAELGVVAVRRRGALRAADDAPEPFRVRVGRRAA